MDRFTRLFVELDRTNRTSEKVAAVEAYFRDAPARDAAWGLFFLAGERLTRVLKGGVMRRAAAAETGLPEWMLDECREAVGDSSETYALLLGNDGGAGESPSLHEVIEEWIRPLGHVDEAQAERRVREAWGRLRGREQRFVFNKLVRGAFRVGVSRGLVVKALARVAGVESDVMAHRLTGRFVPSASAFERLMSGQTSDDDRSRPYPFCLANQLNDGPESLGDIGDWLVEYKWDGIRAQMLRRAGPAEEGGRPRTLIWSRGEEIVTEQFPEIVAASAALPVGTVLDGEILAWRHDDSHGGEGAALGFNALQTRLNRKNAQPGLFDVEGVVFVAFDVLEYEGRDVRESPLYARRELLERILRERIDVHGGRGGAVKVSRVLNPSSWQEAARLRAEARQTHNAEGLVLKHRASGYHVGRAVVSVEREEDADDGAGDGDVGAESAALGANVGAAGGVGGVGGWWKWKIEPFAVDAVLMAAQPGSGKRAGLFTDYTFGVWDGDQITPFAKAYSGLDADEIAKVDAFVRRNTTGRAGPVRMVKPELVFEIGFEGIRASTRHRSGVAVRFPRILRWRTDKRAEEANTIAFVRELLAKHG
jgi:DNA ligase-1